MDRQKLIGIPSAPRKRILRRLKNFLARSPQSRAFALRNWFARMMGAAAQIRGTGIAGVFPAFLPESYWLNKNHSEFAGLYRRFTAYNKQNNGADGARLWTFVLNIKHVIDSGVEGDFAELGVWRGNTAAILAYYASVASRDVYLFDTFAGFAEEDMVNLDANKGMAFSDTSVDLVRKVIGENASRCKFIEGYFPASVTAEAASRRYAVVSLDCDLYAPMRAGLDFFYQRMPHNGLFLLHDYSSLQWDGATKAINEFCAEHDETLVLIPDKAGSALIRKRGRDN